jgi:hypothetical protein
MAQISDILIRGLVLKNSNLFVILDIDHGRKAHLALSLCLQEKAEHKYLPLPLLLYHPTPRIFPNKCVYAPFL